MARIFTEILKSGFFSIKSVKPGFSFFMGATWLLFTKTICVTHYNFCIHRYKNFEAWTHKISGSEWDIKDLLQQEEWKNVDWFSLLLISNTHKSHHILSYSQVKNPLSSSTWYSSPCKCTVWCWEHLFLKRLLSGLDFLKQEWYKVFWGISCISWTSLQP